MAYATQKYRKTSLLGLALSLGPGLGLLLGLALWLGEELGLLLVLANRLPAMYIAHKPSTNPRQCT